MDVGGASKIPSFLQKRVAVGPVQMSLHLLRSSLTAATARTKPAGLIANLNLIAAGKIGGPAPILRTQKAR